MAFGEVGVKAELFEGGTKDGEEGVVAVGGEVVFGALEMVEGVDGVLVGKGADSVSGALTRGEGREGKVGVMGVGNSEYCHHRITDILFDESIVIAHDFGNFAKDPTCDLFDFFRIQLFGHSCISCKVGEKDCNVLSFTFSCNLSWYGLFGW